MYLLQVIIYICIYYRLLYIYVSTTGHYTYMYLLQVIIYLCIYYRSLYIYMYLLQVIIYICIYYRSLYIYVSTSTIIILVLSVFVHYLPFPFLPKELLKEVINQRIVPTEQVKDYQSMMTYPIFSIIFPVSI